MAKPEFDRGPVSPDLLLNTIVMGLKKTEQQQADLDKFLTDLQDPTSPHFHKWLGPEQFADRFGISENDIGKIKTWLEAGGFTVQTVSRGRDMIMFSGSAGQVERVFQTRIHRYLVNGKEHRDGDRAPSIPYEMTDLVSTLRGLDDFTPQPKMTKARPAGALSDLLAGVPPQLTDPTGGHLLVPDDLAIIYNLSPVYQSGIDGSGITIAVAGDSNIDVKDIQAFRKSLHLAANDPVKMLVPKTPDPGMVELGEPDLDLEWAGAIAPKAKILYVYSADPFLAALYAIDQNLAPIVAFSYGVCEWHFIPDDFNFYRSYSQKAAAQGITWVAAAGDSGAAGCEDQNQSWSYATTRMAVDMPSSLPEVTAVGGTEFNEENTAYWSSTPGPNLGTATSYIPETAWNDESLILKNLAGVPYSTAGYGFASGGGGMSMFWRKPAWQAGPGVPNDGARDVPDISLTASGAHDPYLVVSEGQAVAFGGTSAGAPSFAGIVALLNQYLLTKTALTQVTIGADTPNGRYYNGAIDEVRISGAARSADWISTEYNNQTSPSTFYTVGSESQP